MDILQIEGTYNTYSFYRSVFAPVESNMYIMIDKQEAIIFDAIDSGEAIKLLKLHKIKKIHLFLTHEHYDHSHGASRLKENFSTVLYCHNECNGHLSTKKRSSSKLVSFVISVLDIKDGGTRYEDFKNNCVEYDLVADEYFEDSQIFNICGHAIYTMHVPGHTPGSSLYIMDNELVFSGDSMIEGNKIITGFRGGNKNDMFNVTLPRLKALPDDLIVMPGHGAPFKKKEFNFEIYNV